MEIVNRNKTNKGRKYLRKKDIDYLYAENAESFNEWFQDNHLSLKLYIELIKCYDADTFNDTYLKTYNTILYSGINITNYKSYFVQSYLTILMDKKVKESRFCELLPNADKEDFDNDYFSQIEEKQKELEQDILNYIYLNYNIRQFELFKMYMSLKPAINYSLLSKITNIRSYTIQRTISRIKKDISSNEEFVKRWKEL